MTKLLYAGPSIEILTEQYAKQARIDETAPITLRTQIEIEAPVGRVWELLAEPTGWSAVLPVIHDVKIDSPVAVGVGFSWKNGNAPLIKSRFAVVEDQRELTWVGESMGTRAVHRHVLKALDGARTLLIAEESFAGLFLTLFFSKAKAEKSLTDWLSALKAASERSGRA